MSDVQTIVEELIENVELYLNSMSYNHKDYVENTNRLWQIAKDAGLFDQVSQAYQEHYFNETHGDNISRDLKCFIDL